MATINVSGQSQLNAALKTAKAGDVLSLAGGDYGSITMPKGSVSGGAVTITSASDSNQAVFQKITASNVHDFTIDNVTFKGTGGGTGLQINNSTDAAVINSSFSDYKIATFMYKDTGLTVSNNTFERMYHDAMNFTDITNGVISNNTYHETNSEPGYTHKDFIQFWTNAQYDQGPSKNILITGNEFTSDDGATHGIFINNEVGTEKYENITITDNYIASSHTHAITVDYADDLEISNNTVIKDGSGTPVINVTPDSTNVKITNNTAPSIADQGNSSWTLSGNKETSSNGYQWTDGKSGSSVSNTGGTAGSNTTAASAGASSDNSSSSGSSSAGSSTDTSTDNSSTDTSTDTSSGAAAVPDSSSEPDNGNGQADQFRFKGTSVDGTTNDTLAHLDFSEGDILTLIYYDQDTFKDIDGGNLVWHNLAGTYVKIDTLTDIQEMVTYSKDMSASVSGDDLTLTIAQDSGTQKILLTGLGHEYQNTFDGALF